MVSLSDLPGLTGATVKTSKVPVSITPNTRGLDFTNSGQPQTQVAPVTLDMLPGIKIGNNALDATFKTRYPATTLAKSIASHETKFVLDSSGKYSTPVNNLQRYSFVHPKTGDLGMYQIKPDTLKAQSIKLLGREVTPQEFLSNPQLQDKLAPLIIDSWRKQYPYLSDQQLIQAWNVGLNGDFKGKKAKDYLANVLEFLPKSIPQDIPLPGQEVNKPTILDKLKGFASSLLSNPFAKSETISKVVPVLQKQATKVAAQNAENQQKINTYLQLSQKSKTQALTPDEKIAVAEGFKALTEQGTSAALGIAGGEGAIVRKIEPAILKELAAVSDSGVVRSLLEKAGFVAEDAAKLAPDIAKSKSVSGIKAIINSADTAGQLLTPVANPTQSLLSEARKYKTPEEFVKAQGTTMYRGGEIRSGQPTWITDAPEYAKSYGKVSESVLPSDVKILDPNTPVARKLAREYYGEKAIVDVMNTGDNSVWYDTNKGFADFLKSKGYDGFENGLNVQIFDPSILKTKSQLTSLWEQAQKGVAGKVSSVLSLQEFNKLSPSEQLTRFTDLAQPDQQKIMLGEVITPQEGSLQNLADEIASGKQKIRVGPTMKTEARVALGKGNYMRIFTRNPSASAMDEIINDFNAKFGTDYSTSDLLDAISNRTADRRAILEQTTATEVKKSQPRIEKGLKNLSLDTKGIPTNAETGAILRQDTNALQASLAEKPQDVKPNFDFTKWKDGATFTLGRETLERNLERVAGPDAQAAKDFLVEPTRLNETNRVLFNNQLINETRALINRLGIKAGSEADALIQRFGEGRISLEELKQLSPKWPQIQEAAAYFRNKYDELLNLVNASRAKFGYNPIPKRPDYFRHFQEIGSAIQQFGLILKEDNLPAEIAGISDIFKPGKPFSSAELQRKGGAFTESAIKGFDNYIQSITRQAFHIDSVQRARTVESMLREAGANDVANLPNLTANISEYANLVAGKKAKFDRAFESIFGRPFYGAVNFVKSRSSANMVAGNISSALTNFIPLTQSLATTDKPAFIRGLFESLSSPLQKNFNEISGVRSNFLTRRFPETIISPTKTQAAAKFASSLFEAVDHFVSKAIVGGKYFENVTHGMSPEEAMKAADAYAGKVLADRSIGQLPNLMGSRSLGILTQFQTEVNNMYSFIVKDIPNISEGSKLKIANAVTQFSIYSYLFNNIYQNVTGRRPTIDPIYAALTAAGISPDGQKRQLGERIARAGADIAGNLPFTGGITGGRFPISAGIPNIGNILKGQGVGKELMKPAFYLLPPFGGGQLKKTLEGAASLQKGQVKSASGKTKLFKVNKTPANVARSLLFGKYSTPEAVSYFQKLGQKKSPAKLKK